MAARAALVVAAHEFVDPRFQQLRSPAEDVDALAGVLADEAVGAFQVDTLVNEPSGEVQRKLERFFSGRKPDDLLLLYFSCHGVKDPAGRLYFVTTNTEFDLLRSTGISASFVSEQMEYSRSKRIVVLLDCCYSGAFLKGFRARGDDAVAVEQLEGRGRAVITASRATEYAFEADQLSSENAKPSLFTGAIVEGLASGRADANGDGKVTVDELYDYVYDAVRGKVAGQTPGRWIDVEGDLVVARNPSPPVAAAELPPEILRALESDMAMQRLGAAYELTTWYQSPDEARQKAATPVLERLRRDYDERVKAVAVATLTSHPGPPVGAAADVSEPMWNPPRAPATMIPSPPDAPAARDTTAAVSDHVPSAARAGPAAPAPPPAPEAAEPPAGSSRPLAGSTEGEDAVRGGATRSAAWMAALGGLSLLAASFPVYMRDADGGGTYLKDTGWHTAGAFVLFLVASGAAYWLLRVKQSTTPALAVLVALLPFALGHGLGQIYPALNMVGNQGVLRPGWYLMMIASGLWILGGAIAAGCLRRQVRISPEWCEVGASRSSRAAALVAVVIGVVTAYGWAAAVGLESSNLFTGVDALILRSAAVVIALVVGWRWVRRRQLARPALAAGALLVAALVAAYLLGGSVGRGPDFWLAASFAVLAVAALVIPVLSVALEPRPAGVALLGGWAAATGAWVPSLEASGQKAGALGAAAVATVVCTVLLARSLGPAAATGDPAPWNGERS